MVSNALLPHRLLTAPHGSCPLGCPQMSPLQPWRRASAGALSSVPVLSWQHLPLPGCFQDESSVQYGNSKEMQQCSRQVPLTIEPQSTPATKLEIWRPPSTAWPLRWNVVKTSCNKPRTRYPPLSTRPRWRSPAPISTVE